MIVSRPCCQPTEQGIVIEGFFYQPDETPSPGAAHVDASFSSSYVSFFTRDVERPVTVHHGEGMFLLWTPGVRTVAQSFIRMQYVEPVTPIPTVTFEIRTLNPAIPYTAGLTWPTQFSAPIIWTISSPVNGADYDSPDIASLVNAQLSGTGGEARIMVISKHSLVGPSFLLDPFTFAFSLWA